MTPDADHQGVPRPVARVVVEGADQAAIALPIITESVPVGLSRLVDRRTP